MDNKNAAAGAGEQENNAAPHAEESMETELSNEETALSANESEEEAAQSVNSEEDEADMPAPEPGKFVKKLLAMTEKQVKWFQIIFGAVCGILIWITLVITSEVQGTGNEVLGYLFIVVFLVFMLLRNRLGKATGWNMNTYTIAMAASLGVAIAITAVYWIATGRLFA